MRINMRNWDDEALLVIAEDTEDELMRRYIKTILIEKYKDKYTIISLYNKMKVDKFVRNDILWAAITSRIINSSYIIEIFMIKETLNKTPMVYLANVAVSTPNEYISNLAFKIGHEKQESYEKEIGIFDKTYDKFYLDEKEMKLERRIIK